MTKTSDDFYIKLTLAVYRVTELFPEGESLKCDIRDLAKEILANLIKGDSKNCSRDIRSLQDLFGLAKAKNWVDSRNFLVLRREYDKIGGKTVENSFSNLSHLRERTKKRQEKIKEISKENREIKLGDLIKVFPGINKRTLMRDLENCLQMGVLKRAGNGRGAYYTARNVT